MALRTLPSIDSVPRILGEFLGTMLLAVVVTGGALAAERLAPTEPGLQLLAASITTGLALGALIAAFDAVSGAEFNPVVTLAKLVSARPDRRVLALALGVLAAQCAAALLGVLLADGMFAAGPGVSRIERAQWAAMLAEVVATAGLVLVILLLQRTGRAGAIAPAVGAYIAAAYWFTSSTAFANPALTIGRVLTAGPAGIAPGGVLPFVLAQTAGAALAVLLARLLVPVPASSAVAGSSATLQR